jgi:hypothetical protein
MAEQVPDADRIARDLARVARGRFVEVELALLDELHHERRRHWLGLGRDVIDGLRRGGDAAFDIGIAESLRPQDLLVPEDDRGHAGDEEARSERFCLLLETRHLVRFGTRHGMGGRGAPVEQQRPRCHRGQCQRSVIPCHRTLQPGWPAGAHRIRPVRARRHV